MLWLAYIALIATGLGIIGRRNRDSWTGGSRVYDTLVIAFMGIVAAANTSAADYSTLYFPAYQDPSAIPDLEPGWIALCALGSWLHLPYNAFACLLTVATMGAMWFFASRLVPNTSLFLALFLVYPGLMSLVQFRQFVASALVALGMLALSRRDGRGAAVFVACVLAAASLHRVSILLLALLAYLPLAHLYDTGRLSRRVGIGLCAGFAAASGLLVANARPIGTALFGEFKTLAYLHLIGVEQGNLSGAASLAGGLRNALYLVGIAVFVCWCARLLVTTPGLLPVGNNDFVMLVALACVVMVVLVPFALITNDFMRLQRYVFAPIIALFASMPLLGREQRPWSSVWPYATVCALFCYSLVVKGTFEYVFVPLLSPDSLSSASAVLSSGTLPFLGW